MVLLLSSCTFDEEPPDYYIEALRPALFFGVPLRFETGQATVWFQTAKMPGPLSPSIKVVAWSNEGGNIFDETLGDTTLDTPEEGKHTQRWFGPVVPPASLAFNNVGIELLPMVPYVAHMGPLSGAMSCEIHVLGPGLLGCAEWIDAVLQGLVQCRDLLSALISCHEFGQGAVRPMVIIAGLAQRQNIMPDTRPVQFIQFGTDLVIYQGDDLTWWYEDLSLSDFSLAQSKGEAHGPFATPEAAARDAATRLDLPIVFMRGGPSVTAPDSDAGRAEQALRDAMLERAQAR